MARFKVLFKQRRMQVLLTLAALLLAVSVVVGSGASFTAQKANAGNVFSAGTLAMTDTASGMSTTISDMVPGDYHTGTVVIKNTGTVQGHFYLEPVVISADSMSGNGFANDLHLVVNDGSTDIYTGPLSGLGQKDLGTWQINDTRTFTFTVSFPDGGTPKSPTTGDNAFMGASTTATFNWTAVSVAKGSL